MKKVSREPKKIKATKKPNTGEPVCKEEEYKQAYLHALADYKNLEHRINNERQRMRDSVKKNIIMELLPVLDNIDQAGIFTKDPGLIMVHTKFIEALGKLGVTEIPLQGEPFNPETAEAIEVIAGDENNIVMKVIQKAYEVNGHIIRHGKVAVSKIQ